MTHLARVSVLLASAFAATAAFAALDPKTDKQVGGVFSNACGDRQQVMLRLYGDVLDVERGGVAVKASRLQSARTAPAGTTVPDFAAHVKGEVKGGGSVALTLTHNAKGLFARIDGDEKTLAPLGAGVVGQTLRHCDPNRNALPGTSPPAGPGSPQDLLKDARFKSTYLKALGPLAGERWVARMEGPAPDLRKVKVAGTEYTLAASCKPHDCADNNLVLLWKPDQAQVLGLVHQRGKNTFVGAPAPAMARELEKLWAAEWRKR